MKIKDSYLRNSYIHGAISQYYDDLTNDGFNVYKNKQMKDLVFDLNAEKGSDKKIYEFRLIGYNRKRNPIERINLIA